jgi:hypothetical protein
MRSHAHIILRELADMSTMMSASLTREETEISVTRTYTTITPAFITLKHSTYIRIYDEPFELFRKRILEE